MALCLALCGCSAALSGAQTAGGNGAVRNTAAATHGEVSIGSARVGASFGTPASPGSPGGHVNLGRGAAAALVLGLVIADIVHYVSSSRFVERVPEGARPERAIAHTCSCYGYRPPDELTSAAARE